MVAKRRARSRAQPMAAEDRREQLLSAALHAFERGGYYGTHVDDVIREADVARGTFYLYFPSKRAVFEALVDRMLAIFLEVRPPGIHAGVETRDEAEKVLRQSLRTVLETFHRHRRLCRLLLEESVGLEKGFALRLAKHVEVWQQRVGDTRRHFAELGIVRADVDVDLVAQLVVGMVLHVTRLHVLAEAAPDFDRLVDGLVDFELRGTFVR